MGRGGRSFGAYLCILFREGVQGNRGVATRVDVGDEAQSVSFGDKDKKRHVATDEPQHRKVSRKKKRLADSHEGAGLVDDCGDAQSLSEGHMSPALFSKRLQAGVETSPLVVKEEPRTPYNENLEDDFDDDPDQTLADMLKEDHGKLPLNGSYQRVCSPQLT